MDSMEITQEPDEHDEPAVATSDGGEKTSDANDYSRFDDISDSDDESDTVKDKSSKSVAACIHDAGVSKEKGNGHFGRQENKEAVDAYNAGIKSLEETSKAPTAANSAQRQEIEALTVSLQLNLAMASIKLHQWNAAVKATNAVIQKDPSNVKALFRRAAARQGLGSFQEAKADLTRLVAIDPENRPAKVELQKLKKRLVEHKKKNKANYSGLFERAGGVYDDKEQLRKEKEAREAKAKAEKRARFDKECARRKDAGEEDITFEAWGKEEEKAAKKKKKEKEEAKDKADRERRAKQKAANPPARKRASSEELDAEDKKILDETKKSGYCYFNRRQSDVEKQLIGDIAPKKVDSSNDLSAVGGGESLNTTPAPQRIDSRKKGGSAWNADGTTWEERDCSDWAKSCLKRSFRSGRATCGLEDFRTNPSAMVNAVDSLDMGAFTRGEEDTDSSLNKLAQLAANLAKVEAKVTKVTKVDGDATVAVVRGTKRYMYDLSLELEYEVSVDESFDMTDEYDISKDKTSVTPARETKYTGTAKFAEISSLTGASEIEVSFKPKVGVSSKHQKRVKEALDGLSKQLTTKCLTEFVMEYHSSF